MKKIDPIKRLQAKIRLLEKDVDDFAALNSDLLDRIKVLESHIEIWKNRVSINQDLAEKFREALKFYAMPEHIWVRSAALAVDKGWIAREALGETKTKEEK